MQNVSLPLYQEGQNVDGEGFTKFNKSIIMAKDIKLAYFVPNDSPPADITRMKEKPKPKRMILKFFKRKAFNGSVLQTRVCVDTTESGETYINLRQTMGNNPCGAIVLTSEEVAQLTEFIKMSKGE